MRQLKFNHLNWGLLFAFCSLFCSCQKEAGEGGTASITGQVYVEDYNSSGVLVREYFAQEERVYISYGDSPAVDDDMRTNFDGTYQFKFLNRGTYTIYAYSDCDTCAAKTEPIFQTITIKKRGEAVEAPLITIKK